MVTRFDILYKSGPVLMLIHPVMITISSSSVITPRVQSKTHWQIIIAGFSKVGGLGHSPPETIPRLCSPPETIYPRLCTGLKLNIVHIRNERYLYMNEHVHAEICICMSEGLNPRGVCRYVHVCKHVAYMCYLVFVCRCVLCVCPLVFHTLYQLLFV